jgi:hypothetical protein
MWRCYDLTSSSYISPYSSTQFTTETSVTRPNISGYNYIGYKYNSSFSNCLNQSSYSGTTTTCSSASASKPYIIFFYEKAISSWQTPTLEKSISGSSYTSYSGSLVIDKYAAGYVTYTTPSYIGKLVIETTSGSTSPDYYSYLATGGTLSAGSGTDRTSAINTSSSYYITKDDDSGTSYDTLISYVCSASTIYYWYVNAEWASSGTYTVPFSLNYYRRYSVSYNANNGSGAPSTSYFYSDNTSFTISSSTPSRTGYTFLGWSTSSSATSPSYTAGSSYTLST